MCDHLSDLVFAVLIVYVPSSEKGRARREGQGGLFPFTLHAGQLMWTATKANMVYLYPICSFGGKNVFIILKLVFGEVPNLMMVKVIYPATMRCLRRRSGRNGGRQGEGGVGMK